MGRTTRHFNNALGEKGDAPKKLRAVLKEKKHNTGTSFSKPVAGMIVENFSINRGHDSVLSDRIREILQNTNEEIAKVFAAGGNGGPHQIGGSFTGTSYTEPKVVFPAAWPSTDLDSIRDIHNNPLHVNPKTTNDNIVVNIIDGGFDTNNSDFKHNFDNYHKVDPTTARITYGSDLSFMIPGGKNLSIITKGIFENFVDLARFDLIQNKTLGDKFGISGKDLSIGMNKEEDVSITIDRLLPKEIFSENTRRQLELFFEKAYVDLHSEDKVSQEYGPIDDVELHLVESELYENIRELISSKLPTGKGLDKEIEIGNNKVKIGKGFSIFGGIYLNYTTQEGKKIIINVDVDKEKKSFILAYHNGNQIKVNEELIASVNNDLGFDKK